MSLYVVSDELNETLRHAHVALEDALEERGSPDALTTCAKHLHEMRGVLQMVEVYGAALLAEEMEATALFMAGFRPGAHGRDEGLDALTRSMVQMPAYLERMLAGGRDIALVLLPLLNDLRAVRGKPLLSESTLLLLNASPNSGVGAMPPRAANGEDLLTLARKLRPSFQLALLGWIKGQGGNEDLSKLARISSAIEMAATDESAHQLWWVVGSVLEALRDGGLETSVSIKRLLGQADREIKRLIDLGEAEYAKSPATDLLNNLLYYVARATSGGERVSAVRRAFNLAELIPGDKQVEDARLGLAAPGARLMKTVAAVIKEDLARVKDVLDIYVRTGAENADELAPQLEMLTKISDTLGVLGLGDLRGDIQNEVQRLNAVVEADSQVDDATLIQIAATLLQVEDSLDQKLTNLVKPVDSESDTTGSVPALDERDQVDYQQVTHAVVRECLINLARLKEGVGRVASNNDDRVGVDNAMGLMRGVTAGLLMLGKNRAMEVAERILNFIESVLKRNRNPLSSENMDRLADAVVSLEYYLETVQVGRRDPWYMLDNAETCLEFLESQKLGEQDEAQGHSPTMQLSPEELAQQLRPSTEREQTEVLGAPEASDVIALPVVSDEAEHIDPELLELFIEESKEEIESIQKYLPRWVDDSGDNEALITVRRSFHTLKGSGRMVGAERIGEYCWSIEDLLNRLINRTLSRTPPMAKFISEAADVLPDLVEQIEVGTEPPQDISFLMMKAAAFAEGDPNAPTMASDASSADAEVQEAAKLEMDPVLLDIFSKETASHLGVVRNYLSNCEGMSPPFPVTDELHRACHTLHGSANMANVERGITVTGALNRMIRRFFDSDRLLSADGLALLGRSVAAIEIFVAEINTHDGPHSDFSRLVEKLHALTDAQTHIDVTEPEAELTLVSEELEPVVAPPSRVDSELAASHEDIEFRPAAGPESGDSDTDDEYDAEIAAIFTEEAGELLEATDEALQQWAGKEGNNEPLRELKRHLHTLKGGARMAGISSMGNLSHELETLLIDVEDGRIPRSDELLALLQRSVDELHRMRDTVDSGQRVSTTDTLLLKLQNFGGVDDSTTPEDDLEATGIVEIVMPSEADLDGDRDLADDQSEDLSDSLSETFLGRIGVANEASSTEESAEIGDEIIIDLDEDALFEATEYQSLEKEPPESSEGHESDMPEHSASVSDATEEPVATDDQRIDDPDVDPEFDPEPTIVSATSAFEAPDADEMLESLMEAGQQGLSETGIHAFDAEAVEEDDDTSLPDSIPDDSDDDSDDVPDGLGSPLPAQRSAQGGLAGKSASGDRQEFARIDAELLEDLLNAAGEISIFHSRLTQQVSLIDFNLAELDQTVSRLRGQLRKLEIETEAQILNRHQDEVRDPGFDPLELDRYSLIQQLSRALAESASDVGSIKELLNSLTGDAETLLVQQARVTAELQDGLMRTRMVPFHRHVPRLTRLVRQAAQETGKQAELSVEGGSGELDRQVLEKMLPPFEHMLRNAVVHGIETEDKRRESNKPTSGRITVRLHREGSEMVIDVSDDGAGLNVDAIRAKAYESGLLAPDANIPDEEIMELILTPGFSTAGELTQSAGRGVGMDVVANEIKKLGGTLRITSIQGQGTNFTIRLPFTLAITQALIVRCGEETFALPLPSVEGVARIPRKTLNDLLATDECLLEYGERSYKIEHLGSAVGGLPTVLPEDDSPVPLILVRKGDVAAALLTDEMLTSREIVVKSVGPQLAGVQGIAGATILGDGSVVLILDTGGLVQRGRSMVELREAPPPLRKKDERPLVLVVDDSITVRRVTERFLKRQDMRAATARDGIDAISRLEEERPDVILLDIEMPRMDGYEFASHVRNDERYHDVPIIMITSRVSEKHKARAIEIGVDDYLGKPYQDHQLLETIQRYLPGSNEDDL